MHLGVSSEERALKQPVLISLILSFREQPEACTQDTLADALCYAKILDHITTAAVEAHTLERLAQCIIDVLEPVVGRYMSKIDLMVCKERPPIPNLLCPVCFRISKEII